MTVSVNEEAFKEQTVFIYKSSNMDEIDTKDTKVQIENRTKKGHIYGVNDSPPLSVTIICGLQVRCLFCVCLFICLFV